MSEVKIKAESDVSIFGDVVGRDKITINLPPPLPPAEAKDRANLLILLHKVKTFWVEGVLEKSLHNTVLLELGKETKPEAVDHPWGMVLELPDQTNQVLPSGTKIIDIFEKMNRAMLILGEPGSGKTITLLELTRNLITRAEADPTQPIPVVFNLSSWTDKRQLLVDWLVLELSTKYQIPEKIGHRWLEDNRILLLLDGLDEVKPENRSACVEAINDFGKTFGLPGRLVCSRLQEYINLPKRLTLEGAICLQALTITQVNDYLEVGDSKLMGLRTALQNDQTLQELAQSPLLLNIISLAYQNWQVEEFATEHQGPVDKRKNLFDAYIDRMFVRKGKSTRPYSKDQTIYWLAWLANKMMEHSKSVFLLEDMQPTWLRTSVQHQVYSLFIFLVMGFLIGLLTYAYFTINRGREVFNIVKATECYKLFAWSIVGLLWSFGVWIIYMIRLKFERMDDSPSFLSIAANVIIKMMIWSSVWGFIYFHNWGAELYLEKLSPPFNAGILASLLASLWEAKRKGLIMQIQTVEKLGWSWLDARKGIMIGVLAGGCILVISMAIEIPTWYDVKNISQLLANDRLYRYALSIWLLMIIGAAIIGGLTRRISKTKTFPNQGIRLSFLNALSLGATFGTLFGVTIASIWFAFGRSPKIGIEVGLILGLIAALWYGGFDILMHFILRLMLFVDCKMPLRYTKFLDSTTNLVFLQKVGGGYIFIHRLLLEHFAAMPEQSKTQKK